MSRMKLLVCTWNVGHAAPPSDLSSWLGRGCEFDIIVIGGQEANFSGDSEKGDVNPDSRQESRRGSYIIELSPSDKKKTPRKGKTKDTNGAVTTPKQNQPDKLVLPNDTKGANGQVEDPNSDSRQGSKRGPYRELSPSGKTRALQKRKTKDNHVVNVPKQNQPDKCVSPSELKDENVQMEGSGRVASSSSSGEEYKKELIDRLGLMQENDDSPNGPTTPTSSVKSLDRAIMSMNSSATSAQNKVAESPQPYIKKMPPACKNSMVWSDSPKFQNPPRTPSSRKWLKSKISGTLNALPGQRRARKGANVKEPNTPLSSSPTNGTEGANVNAKRFSGRMERALGDQYVLIAKHHLMEIKLLVFVNQRIKDRVTRAGRASEATGLGHVVGNKGGVAVKLTIDDTSFCFVSCHLAAHEGAKFLKDRNEDVLEIMRNIEKTKSIGLPAVHQFDHLIWVGDLNYRLDLERFLPESAGWDRTRKWEFIRKQISNGNYETLCKLDELAHEMRLSNVFGNFREGKITFMPTYKTIRNSQTPDYQSLRIPSYCDRILWHSLPLHRNHLVLKEYQSVPEISTSDHKPVYAIFNLFVPKPIRFYSMPAPSNAVKCTVDFHSLKLVGLYERESVSPNGGFKADVLDEEASYSPPLEVSSLFSPEPNTGKLAFKSPEEAKTVTKRPVRVEFYAGSLFAKQKAHRTEVPLRDGLVRECTYDELPTIALVPLAGITELAFKYISVVFSRMGTRQGASCVLPLVKLVQAAGNRTLLTLDLTKYGSTIAQVELDVELVCSMHCWITSKNKIVKVRRKWK